MFAALRETTYDAATERSKVPVADWVAAEPKVAEWAKRISMKSEETAKVYASSLRGRVCLFKAIVGQSDEW